ncbi:MAG: phosphoribosylformylglycinamidine synthase subunit PurS [Bacteroidota bacterium]
MKFKATIYIMPRKEILDPQGKATLSGLHNLGYGQISQVRIGKQIEVHLEASDKTSAEATIEETCKKLLANPIIEQYSFELEAL